MDKLEIQFYSDYYFDIMINDEPFIGLIRTAEVPITEQLRDKSRKLKRVPGNYSAAKMNVIPPDYFLYDILLTPEREIMEEGEAGRSILFCSCVTDGCANSFVHITVKKDTVVWSNFRTPVTRAAEANLGWRGQLLRPFVFDRQDYESALLESYNSKRP